MYINNICHGLKSQKLTIKNLTNEDIKDIELVYKGLEKKPYKISIIPKNGQKDVYLIIAHLLQESELKLIYSENNISHEQVIYKKLIRDDYRDLNLNIEKSEGKIIFTLI